MSSWDIDYHEPLVTVLCPTYNHESFIRNAIHGFLVQKTSFPFQIVIHDDASTDRTASIIREYEERYPKLITGIYQRTNLRSRNLGRDKYVEPLTKGKFVAICEGDDYWTDSRKLEDQARYLLQYPDCSMVCQPHINAEITLDGLVARGGVRETYLTLTRMYRQEVRREYPEELRGIPNGDRGTLVFFATRGRLAHLSHLKPAVRIMHSGGAMSMQSAGNQISRQVVTWRRIYLYYKDTRFGPAVRLKYLQILARKLAYEASVLKGWPTLKKRAELLAVKLAAFVLKSRGHQRLLPEIFRSRVLSDKPSK